MERERLEVRSWLVFLLDATLLLYAFMVSYSLRMTWLFVGGLTLAPMVEYTWLVMAHTAICLVVLALSGTYSPQVQLGFLQTVWNIIKSVGLSIGLIVLFLFLVKDHSLSRSLVGLLGVISVLVLLLEKSALKLISDSMRRRGVAAIQAIVVGTGRRAQMLMDSLDNHPELGYSVIGLMDVEPELVGQTVRGVPVLGTLGSLPKILDSHQVDEVFFAMPFHMLPDLKRRIYICEEVGVRATVMAEFIRPAIATTRITTHLGIPLLSYSTTPTQVWQLLVKEIFDRIAALIILVLIMPLLIALALAIRLDSRGPVLFNQVRSGLHGRRFKMLKFRTMVHGAESMRDELEGLNEMNGPVFKIKRDPRVTRIGSLLRRYSLDELPQFWNVLTGEMSIVGPRPPIPSEVDKYERWQRRRLSMKPGLTCYWQISGRNEVDFDAWMELDLKYIDNWSLLLDAMILLRTIPVVLLGKGAS
ncbi:MAG: sugar transferase [Candidatus Alcyoniella australis]|nr:sugar transferase [Candidatus Alcyoniella australis]